MLSYTASFVPYPVGWIRRSTRQPSKALALHRALAEKATLNRESGTLASLPFRIFSSEQSFIRTG